MISPSRDPLSRRRPPPVTNCACGRASGTPERSSTACHSYGAELLSREGRGRAGWEPSPGEATATHRHRSGGRQRAAPAPRRDRWTLRRQPFPGPLRTRTPSRGEVRGGEASRPAFRGRAAGATLLPVNASLGGELQSGAPQSGFWAGSTRTRPQRGGGEPCQGRRAYRPIFTSCLFPRARDSAHPAATRPGSRVPGFIRRGGHRRARTAGDGRRSRSRRARLQRSRGAQPAPPSTARAGLGDAATMRFAWRERQPQWGEAPR